MWLALPVVYLASDTNHRVLFSIEDQLKPNDLQDAWKPPTLSCPPEMDNSPCGYRGET